MPQPAARTIITDGIIMEVEGHETGIDLQCLCQLPCTIITNGITDEVEGRRPGIDL